MNSAPEWISEEAYKRIVSEAPVDVERAATLGGKWTIVIRPDMPDMVAGRLSVVGTYRDLESDWQVEVNGHHGAARRRYLIGHVVDEYIYSYGDIAHGTDYDIEYNRNDDAFCDDGGYGVMGVLIPRALAEALGYGTFAAPWEVAEALGVSERALRVSFDPEVVYPIPSDYFDLSPEAVMAEIEPRGAAKIERLMGEAPVDVEGIAVEHGLTIRIRGDLADEVCGSLLREEPGWTIEVNGLHHIHRRRHTTALELAHFLNHRDAVGGGITHRRDGTGGLAPSLEAAANAAATEMLMPLPLVARLQARPKPPLIGIARTLGVSEAALAKRLAGREPVAADYDEVTPA